MNVLKNVTKVLAIAAVVVVVSSCFKSNYSESYQLVANFEYGKVLELRKDSTYFAAEGFGIGFNYLVFCHDIDMTTKEYKGGFRISALEGQIRPVKEEENDSEHVDSDEVAPLDMVWRAHSVPGVNTYMVYYMSQNRPEYDIEFLMPTNGTCVMKACHVTNTAKVAEEIATKFVRGDKMTLKAIGYKDGKETGVAEIALADFTQNDKAGQPKDSIVSRWTTFDLSKLAAVDKVRFEIEMLGESDVQKYFCLDNLIADIAIEY
jgi:hypothetical protein